MIIFCLVNLWRLGRWFCVLRRFDLFGNFICNVNIEFYVVEGLWIWVGEWNDDLIIYVDDWFIIGYEYFFGEGIDILIFLLIWFSYKIFWFESYVVDMLIILMRIDWIIRDLGLWVWWLCLKVFFWFIKFII